jgi:hypothetical protein
VDVSESVDLPAGEMGGGGHQILMFGAKSELIGESSGVDVRTKTGMLCNILNPFPVIIDDMMKVFETLDVIFFGHDSFHFFLSSKIFNFTPTLSLPHRGGGFLIGSPN